MEFANGDVTEALIVRQSENDMGLQFIEPIEDVDHLIAA